MTLASPAHPEPTEHEAGELLQHSVLGISPFDVRFALVRTFPQGTRVYGAGPKPGTRVLISGRYVVAVEVLPSLGCRREGYSEC